MDCNHITVQFNQDLLVYILQYVQPRDNLLRLRLLGSEMRDAVDRVLMDENNLALDVYSCHIKVWPTEIASVHMHPGLQYWINHRMSVTWVIQFKNLRSHHHDHKFDMMLVRSTNDLPESTKKILHTVRFPTRLYSYEDLRIINGSAGVSIMQMNNDKLMDIGWELDQRQNLPPLQFRVVSVCKFYIDMFVIFPDVEIILCDLFEHNKVHDVYPKVKKIHIYNMYMPDKNVLCKWFPNATIQYWSE